MNELKFQVSSTADIARFFAEHNASVVVSGYKANAVLTFGCTDTGKLGCFYTRMNHPMAVSLANNAGTPEVWIAGKNHLIRHAPVKPVYNQGSEAAGGDGDFTATFVPRQLHAVGTQDVHRIVPVDPNAPHFVSTALSALCQLDPSNPSVTAKCVWHPSFISELRAEDRCHLNDVCFVDGAPKYASCICESDAHDGWRDHRESGGVLIDVETNDVIVRGLSMPHSPRVYRDELWLLNSGTGELGVIEGSEFIPRVFLPGFLRGLQFIGRYAVVGSSLDRKEARFQGLKLGKRLDEKKTSPVCGLFFVDLADYSIAHKIELTGDIDEIYDVALVPGRRARVMSVSDEESVAKMHWIQ